MRTIFAVALFLSANACAPVVVQQTARTVKPGGVQTGMALSAVTGVYEEEEGDKGTSTYVGTLPTAWARFGLASNADMGVNFYGSGVRLDGKFAPLQSDQMALAVCAGVGGGAQQSRDTSTTSAGGEGDSTDNHQWFGDVGLLFTTALGPTLDLTAGARFVHGESYASETFDGEESKESSQTRAFGGHLGVLIKRGSWGISPEIAVYQATNEDTETPDSASDELIIVPSVGFTVGF